MLCIALSFSVPKRWRLTLNLSSADVIPHPPSSQAGEEPAFAKEPPPCSRQKRIEFHAGCPPSLFEGGDFFSTPKIQPSADGLAFHLILALT